METKILELLRKILPSKTNIIVKHYEGWFGGSFTKIMFSVSNHEIHQVKEQFPQVVSLLLDKKTLELSVQIFGGMGGNHIYRKPNMDDPKEKYLAMKSVKIPFRTPKKEEKNVLECIERFGKNWLQALKDNKNELMYQNIVNYDEFLTS